SAPRVVGPTKFPELRPGIGIRRRAVLRDQCLLDAVDRRVGAFLEPLFARSADDALFARDAHRCDVPFRLSGFDVAHCSIAGAGDRAVLPFRHDLLRGLLDLRLGEARLESLANGLTVGLDAEVTPRG